ncbi:hypothetical protein ACUXV3_07320 [Roseobacteraceae bacterium NS-SX3]
MSLALRRYLGLFLALAIGLTAHSAAAMRGMRDATGTMVLCTGTGPVTVYVDSDGQPAKPPHLCPDCVMHLLDAVAPLEAQPERAAAHGTAEPEEEARLAAARPVLRACARAPPSLA